MGAYFDLDRTGHDRRIWFIERIDFFNHHLWLGDEAGARVKLDVPTDVWMEVYRDWLVIKLRTAWTVGGRIFAPDAVLGISLSAFLEGDRKFTVVFEPGPRRSLQGFFWAAGRLVLSILDELRPVLQVCTPSANVQDPLTPSSLMLIENLGVPTLLKQAPRTFSADGLVVTQHEAISIDGERIPYVQTGPAAETGDAPVHMTAYGGFGLAVRPYYNSSLGKLWLERGGTTVLANIRGGGEFGTRWHDAGRYAGKRLAHDDFAAVAADLVRRGVTRPGRIAAEGGSNGGILISNMLVRYPERFGALFCTIPLIDMRRYTKLLAGASWIAEYGDPDKSEEWEWLKTYSAYHLAKPGEKYPPILIATTRRDDRVHPGHARKMTAKLQAIGCEAYLYEPAAGGHGYGKDNKERAAFVALGYTFLKTKIGWPDGT
jgi:prolyl oligopeptidase